MKSKIIEFQNKVLTVLSGKIDDFYLAGGTALSLYYFHHRHSLDLDFFTKTFSMAGIIRITELISSSLNKRVELISEEAHKNKVKIAVYLILIDKKHSLKIDFVEDYVNLLKSPKLINGIAVLSLEDIYLRKLYAITGTYYIEDDVGKKMAKGGRQEAKDFYDLYCLSQIFMRLSNFSLKYGNPLMREAIIRWFRTYSRFDMKTGLLELQLKKNVDYADIERHFKKEVDKIIEKEVDFI